MKLGTPSKVVDLVPRTGLVSLHDVYAVYGPAEIRNGRPHHGGTFCSMPTASLFDLALSERKHSADCPNVTTCLSLIRTHCQIPAWMIFCRATSIADPGARE